MKYTILDDILEWMILINKQEEIKDNSDFRRRFSQT